MKGINSESTPRIDGWNAHFFKQNWHITRYDIYQAVINFFSSSIMYEPINSTCITLIPKSFQTGTTKQYRLVSCYSTLYKIISKIIAGRL